MATKEIIITVSVWFKKIEDFTENGTIGSTPNASIDSANSPVKGMGL